MMKNDEIIRKNNKNNPKKIKEKKVNGKLGLSSIL